MDSGPFIEQADQAMQWLAREAPQFHSDSASGFPPCFIAPDDIVEDYSSGSDSDSDGSDSDNDPYDPYHLHNPTKKWVRNGDYVYEADDNLKVNL